MKKRRQRFKCPKSTNVKGLFIRMKQKINSVMSVIVRLMPVAIVFAPLGLILSDQGTDMASAHRICTAHCDCEPMWVGTCHPPVGSCSSSNINGKTASEHCEPIPFANISIDEKACIAKNPWLIPETYHALGEKVQCSCKYLPTSAACIVSDQNCFSVIINGTPASDYCKIENRIDRCYAKDTWEVSAAQLQFRHPFWCSISTGCIIGPSILNNIFLLYSLLHKSNYKRYFVAAGVSCLADIQYTNIAIILLSIFQVLPYIVLVLKIVIVLRICLKYIDEDVDSNDLKVLTTRMNVIFSFTEDLPQLTLQMMFFHRAIDGYNYGITDAISWVTVIGLLTSCISLSKNYTEFITGPQSSVGSKLFTFLTAFTAAGGRILTSCLFEDFRSWRIFIPISLIIAINIISSFCNFIFNLCVNIKGYKYSFQTENKDILPPQETKYQRLLSVLCKTGIGIRSIIFGAIMDCQSISGLWASTCFVWVAMWIRSYWIPEQACNIALTVTMLSYIINTVTVLLHGQYRRQGLLMAVLFLIFPIGIFIYGFYEYELSNHFIHELLELAYLEITPEIFIFTIAIGMFVILSFIILLVLDMMKVVNTEKEVLA